MNVKERLEWMTALADTYPGVSLGPLIQALSALDERLPKARWEAGASAGEWPQGPLVLRCFGDDPGHFHGWLATAAASFGAAPAPELPGPPADGLPWLTLRWDLRGGRRQAISLHGRGEGLLFDGSAEPTRIRLAPAPFSPKAFGDPVLARVFRELEDLHPPRDRVRSWRARAGEPWTSADDWALRLEPAVPWPRFLRLDIAKGFSNGASQIAFLLRGREVRELAFEGENLRAYLT